MEIENTASGITLNKWVWFGLFGQVIVDNAQNSFPQIKINNKVN